MSNPYSINFQKIMSAKKTNHPPSASNFSSTTNINSKNYSYNYMYQSNENESQFEGFNKISQVRKAKYKIKLEYKLDKEIRQEKLKSAHKQILRQKLQKNRSVENVFITTEFDWAAASNKETMTTNQNRLLSSQKDIRNKNIDERRTVFNFYSNSNKKEPNTCDKIYEKRESALELKNKVLFSSKVKLIENVLNERKVRIEEKIVNKIEEINDNMKQKKNSERLLMEWETGFLNYIRSLKVNRDCEKNKLEKITRELYKVEQDIDLVSNSIHKIQKDIDNYVRIRDFLIRVKENKKELPAKFYDKVKELDDEAKKNMGIKNSVFHLFKSADNRLSKRRKTHNVFIEEKDEQQIEIDRMINYVKHHKVFDSVNEFNYIFNKLEKNNLKFLDQFNENNESILKIKKENENLEKYISINEKKLNYESSLKEEKLNQLKSQFKLLSEIKASQLNEESSNLSNLKLNTSSSTTNIKRNLNEKLKPLNYYIISNLDPLVAMFREKLPNISLSDNYLNMYFNNKQETDLEQINMRVITLLKDVEKGLNFLMDKYKNYKILDKQNKYSNIDKNSLQNIEHRLEKERKYKKAHDQKLINENNSEIIKQKILERAERIIVLPKRHVDYKCKPKEKNTKKEHQSLELEEDLENI